MKNEVISKDNAMYYQWGEQCDGWHLVDTYDLSIIKERMPPGTREAKHYHQTANQFFYILEGEATIELESKTFVLRPSEGLYIKAGQVHTIRNNLDEDLLFIVTSSPHSHGDRIIV